MATKKVDRGIIYHTDGTMILAVPSNGKKFMLEELQKAVGGYIQIVPNSSPASYCNEEGLVYGLPYNAQASKRFGVNLVGPVIERYKTEV